MSELDPTLPAAEFDAGLPYDPTPPARVLQRSSSDHIIGGVCAGIANYFGLDPTLVRVAFALLLVPGGLPGFLPYVVLWIIMPDDMGRRASVPMIIFMLCAMVGLCGVFLTLALAFFGIIGSIFG